MVPLDSDIGEFTGMIQRHSFDDSMLRVRSAFRTAVIPLGDIATAELKTGWWWGTVRVRHVSGKAVV